MKCAALLAVVLAFSGAPAAAMACALECRPEAAAAHADHHGGTAHGDSAAAASHQRAGHPAPPVQSRAVGAFHDCAHDPAVIRVTVHPTVEAFGRATGQPWWVSGASDGASIDLLPLSLLRQRGQLERTVRHEVAHVLVDGALEDRPLWVREGAAFYFADPGSGSDASMRGGCPEDEEFLRPLSAGAHRAAYARAEACFRRAIAQGRRWTDVR